MIVQLLDTVTGAAVSINPVDVVTLKPDPAAPERVSMIKLRVEKPGLTQEYRPFRGDS